MTRHSSGRTLFATLAVTVGFAAAAPLAHAQWSAMVLHPVGVAGGADESFLYGGAGWQQSGGIRLGEDYRALVWNGSPAAWTDLTPAGFAYSFALRCSGGKQVGTVRMVGGGVGLDRASLWSGTAASWVDLHPAGGSESLAHGVSGTQQVGYAIVGNTNHASLWSGTAVSWVDLHPSGADWSDAFGISGARQVGSARIGGLSHASLWSGSAASWVDLHPAAASESYGFGASNTGLQQVGYATIGGSDHASLWSGTAASWVDLNPAGADYSYAWDAGGSFQVGHANIGGLDRAGYWSGTAASWVDLHAFVPAEFSGSYGEAIWTDSGNLYIAGYGFNDTSATWEALLWTKPLVGGACCNRWTGHCTHSDEAACVAFGLRFDGPGSVCSPAICQASPADFNGSGVVSVQDIFDFLAAYFAGSP